MLAGVVLCSCCYSYYQQYFGVVGRGGKPRVVITWSARTSNQKTDILWSAVHIVVAAVVVVVIVSASIVSKCRVLVSCVTVSSSSQL